MLFARALSAAIGISPAAAMAIAVDHWQDFAATPNLTPSVAAQLFVARQLAAEASISPAAAVQLAVARQLAADVGVSPSVVEALINPRALASAPAITPAVAAVLTNPRALAAAVGITPSVAESLRVAPPPSVLWGTARNLEELYATDTYVLRTGSLVDTWTDIAPTPHNYTATTTARPTYTAPDGSIGSLGYITGDGVDDVMTSTLNIPAPLTTPTFHALLVKIDSFTNLDRLMAGAGLSSVQVIYQTPSTPYLSMLNGASIACNTNPASALGVWLFVMAMFTGTQSGDFLQIGNTRVSSYACGNLSTTGRKLFGDLAAGRFGAVKLAHKLAISGVPTNTEIATYARYLREIWQVPSSVVPVLGNALDVNIVHDGDSMTSMGNTVGMTAASQYSSSSRYVHRHVIGIGGSRIDEATTRYSTNVTPRYNAACPINIYHFRSGANDIDAGASLATLQTRLAAHLTAVNATGWPRKWVSPIREATRWASGSAIDNVRLAYNSWLEANYLALGWTRFVEARGLCTAFGDDIHGTTAGNAGEVPTYEAALAAEV